MIQIVDKGDCCGCSACAGVCPKKCISMTEDSEGFRYPVVDTKRCIECNVCVRVCPIMNPYPETVAKQVGYVIQSKDKKVLEESTSGGAFTAIAEYVIHKHGVVYGAALNDNFEVFHMYVEDEAELGRFRNSKYVQSTIDPEIYRTIKRFLKEGRLVLFSGTPCQIEGLLHAVGDSYANLITVDILCHSVPSPLVYRKYLDYLKNTLNSDIATIRFRDKYYGYKYPTLSITTNTLKRYHRGSESDPWLRAFLSGICSRPSCYCCKFKKRYRKCDFTLWDCHDPETFSSEFDIDGGTTNVLIHTQKGCEIIKEIAASTFNVEVRPDTLIKSGAGSLSHCIEKPDKREMFLNDAKELSGIQLMNKYFPLTGKVKVKHYIRVILCEIGLYYKMKQLILKIKN